MASSEHITKNKLRLRQIQDGERTGVNLVLIPGGPGMSSDYFFSLTRFIDRDYGVYLCDLPGNGHYESAVSDEIYQNWPLILEDIFDVLDNVILLGHSFGGMLIQSKKALEEKSRGLILMNTVPYNIFSDKSGRFFQEPLIKKYLKDYQDRPSDNSYKQLALSLVPLFFKPNDLDRGYQMLQETSFSQRARDIMFLNFVQSFRAQYTPIKPTLILTSEQDIATPAFVMDTYLPFKNCENIQMTCIMNANHFPWICNPEEVVRTLDIWLSQFLH